MGMLKVLTTSGNNTAFTCTLEILTIIEFKTDLQAQAHYAMMVYMIAWFMYEALIHAHNQLMISI